LELFLNKETVQIFAIDKKNQGDFRDVHKLINWEYQDLGWSCDML